MQVHHEKPGISKKLHFSLQWKWCESAAKFILMKKHKRIEINPDIMFGKPVIKNTRITVELILNKLGGGLSTEQIIKEHPQLKAEDIRAAQQFAADEMAMEEVIYTEKSE